MQYDLVKAKDLKEAKDKSIFKKGDLYYISDLKFSPNSDGTYTVTPTFLKCSDFGDKV